jgi:protein phosphatase
MTQNNSNPAASNCGPPTTLPLYEPDVPSSEVQVDMAAVSHPGKVRTNNEDHYLVIKLERSLELMLTNLPQGLVPDREAEMAYGMLVADGMGGPAAGEVASQAALQFLIHLILRTPDWIMRLDEQGRREVLRRTDQRIHQVSDNLLQMAEDNPSLLGMGTTLTLAGSLGRELLVAHVGDSRVYLFHGGQVRRLTRDHTLVQKLVEFGQLSPAEAAKHPLRHLLLNALGSRGDPVRVEVNQLRLSDGDRVLLCTDGLTDMVPDDRIAEILGQDRAAAETCQALVDQALEAGGKDNITVVLGRYTFKPWHAQA